MAEVLIAFGIMAVLGLLGVLVDSTKEAEFWIVRLESPAMTRLVSLRPTIVDKGHEMREQHKAVDMIMYDTSPITKVAEPAPILVSSGSTFTFPTTYTAPATSSFAFSWTSSEGIKFTLPDGISTISTGPTEGLSDGSPSTDVDNDADE